MWLCKHRSLSSLEPLKVDRLVGVTSLNAVALNNVTLICEASASGFAVSENS